MSEKPEYGSTYASATSSTSPLYLTKQNILDALNAPWTGPCLDWYCENCNAHLLVFYGPDCDWICPSCKVELSIASTFKAERP